MSIRAATPADADAIAGLHADSWQRHYRGSYREAYLDEEVVADRREVWSRRFAAPDPNALTLVAEDRSGITGFARTVLGHDPYYGAFLDSLHVRHDRWRMGIGRNLMRETADVLVTRTPGSGLYLWVLDANVVGQAFYEALGGVLDGEKEPRAPGGGTVIEFRFVWPDAAALRTLHQH